MDDEEYLYYTFFWISILAAFIDRKIDDTKSKKIYGATVGLIFVLILCRSQAVFPIVNVLVNCGIAAFCNKKKCYMMSLIFSLSYLYFVRKCSPSAFCNAIIMMTTLKMIGVACEINENSSGNDDTKKNLKKSRIRYDTITYGDIFSYGFHYTGLIGPPYYTYATYDDYMKLPFRRYHNWKTLSVCKLISSISILSLYLIFHKTWPLSYAYHDDFYTKQTTLYRILYIYPLAYGTIFRIWHAFILFECSCFISGLGVYPCFTKPKCGYGPTETLEELSTLKDDKYLEKQDYSFATIINTDILKFHSTLSFGQTARYWNTTVQFWLYNMVCKQIPYQKFKIPITMLVSSYWHGLDFGYFASVFLYSLFSILDKRWQELLKDNQSFYSKLLRQFVKFHFLYSLLTSFLLKQRNRIIRYQESVYYHSVIILLLYYFLLIFYERKKRRKLD